MSEVIVFDVGSFFAYFRKSYTTTFGLTYSVIPRSSAEGLLGAIIGLSRDSFPRILADAKIAVQLLSSVQKINVKIMHTHPDWWDSDLSSYLTNEEKKSKGFRAPASAEFLLNTHYRIYVDAPQINDKLLENLQKSQSYYTPYLGSSSMISYLRFVGMHDYTIKNLAEYGPIKSVIPFEKIPDIKIQTKQSFAIEDSMPLHLDSDRNLYGIYNIIYNPTGEDLLARDLDIIRLDDKENTNIVFLPIAS